MFYIPNTSGSTPTERNERRTSDIAASIGSLARDLRERAAALDAMIVMMENTEEFGEEDNLDAATLRGRGDWVARTLNDTINRAQRDDAEAILRATMTAARYEITTKNGA